VPTRHGRERRPRGCEGRPRQHYRQCREVLATWRRRKVAVTTGPDEAVITVADAGPGVPPEDVPPLFQRFYRGKASRATDAPGVGLGLAISRALIERQGGRLSVEVSGGEKGATFTVHLPRA
jgi:signal transduction histidine kinase